MLGVIVLLGLFSDTRVALYVGGVWLVLLTIAYKIWVRGEGRERAVLVDESSVRVSKRGRLSPSTTTDTRP